MSEQQHASQTAETTLFLRALACYETDARIRGNDHMAEFFLSEEKRCNLRRETYRNAVKDALPNGLYAYIIARTAYFDELFSNNVFPQIVLLGAGYDTRAYRLTLPESGKVFEVDAPPTQQQKQCILKKNGVGWTGTTYVPVDFEKDALALRLVEHGYDPTLKALYIWEGVTPYLTPEAVTTTLLALRNIAAPGSLLAFDYLNRSVSAEQDIRRKDEQVLFGMTPAALECSINRLGWRTLENLDTSSMEERWLTGENGERFDAVKSTMNFLKAEVACQPA